MLNTSINLLLAPYLERWMLIPDGELWTTQSSYLLPVKQGYTSLLLKFALAAEEKQGGFLMAWWGGKGAARVVEHDGDALLLERATGKDSLLELVRQGQDSRASEIICQVAAHLHAPRHELTPPLVPLGDWFRDLQTAGGQYGGIMAQSASIARELLANPQDVCVLHGDLHHGNVLDFGQRGWLAIDPKGLVGERGFDFANIFCNPSAAVALAPGRLADQVHVVSQAAKLDRKRLLQWVLAWAGLSATWLLLEEVDPSATLAVATLAASKLR